MFYLVKTKTVGKNGEERTGYAGYDVENDVFDYLHAVSSEHLCVFKTPETAEKIAETVKAAVSDAAYLNEIVSFEVSVEEPPADFQGWDQIKSLVGNAAYYYYVSQCCVRPATV